MECTYPLHRFLWENDFCKTSREAKRLVQLGRIYHKRPGWAGNGKQLSIFFGAEDVRKGDDIILKDKQGNVLKVQAYTFKSHLES